MCPRRNCCSENTILTDTENDEKVFLLLYNLGATAKVFFLLLFYFCSFCWILSIKTKENTCTNLELGKVAEKLLIENGLAELGRKQKH